MIEPIQVAKVVNLITENIYGFLKIVQIIAVQFHGGYANYLICSEMVLNNENNKEIILGTISTRYHLI